MDTAATVSAGRQGSTRRSGCSPKLLARKAREAANAAQVEPPLEECFPDSEPLATVRADGETESGTRPAGALKRGEKDRSAQRLRPGTINPNPQTVLRTIFDLVAERGEVSRGELLDMMASATFPHPKAKPHDRGWCQGYISGAIRAGFLATVAEEPAQDGAHVRNGEA